AARGGVAAGPADDDLAAVAGLAAKVQMQLFEAARAAHGIDAPGAAAAAGEMGNVGRRIAGGGGEDGGVAPFAGIAAPAVGETAFDDEATADAGAENDAEDHIVPLPRPEPGFG